MTREDSFLSLNSWTSGSLKFNFKTRQTEAVLLYQSSGEQMGDIAPDKLNKMYIRIMSGRLRKKWKNWKPKLKSNRATLSSLCDDENSEKVEGVIGLKCSELS